MANQITAEELQSFIERIETLTEEKQSVQDSIKDVFAEARGRGYDAAIMREIIKLRKMSEDDRMVQDAILRTYLSALGMD
jgi:uncharacterized protein (UPF0335 family)